MTQRGFIMLAPLLSLATNPRVLIGVALVAALGYSHYQAHSAGAAGVRSDWEAQVARDATQAAKRQSAQRERNLERAAEVNASSAAIEIKLRKDVQDANAQRGRLVDDLVAGRVRIKPFNESSGSGAVSPPAAACLDEREAEGLRRRVAQTVAIGAKCTAERDAYRAEVTERAKVVNGR